MNLINLEVIHVTFDAILFLFVISSFFTGESFDVSL